MYPSSKRTNNEKFDQKTFVAHNVSRSTCIIPRMDTWQNCWNDLTWLLPFQLSQCGQPGAKAKMRRSRAAILGGGRSRERRGNREYKEKQRETKHHSHWRCRDFLWAQTLANSIWQAAHSVSCPTFHRILCGSSLAVINAALVDGIIVKATSQ